MSRKLTKAECGRLGAKATNTKLTKAQRKANATKAARALWAKIRGGKR